MEQTTQAQAPEEQFGHAYERIYGVAPPPIDNPQLAHYWNLPVSDLCTLVGPDAQPIAAEMQERHRLYLYLLMALGWFYWNGFKYGRNGTYPWNPTPTPDDPDWLEGDYRGHNIVAVAADPQGRVVDFDFNHNELFSSTAEHAEARLVRRLYGLTNLPEAQTGGFAANLDASLTGYTVYTSLESCAQCSGIMALATVSQVVFMQTDPGEYLIGRILRNLTPPYLRAPLPISGAEVGLGQFDELNQDFANFTHGLSPTRPFWEGNGVTNVSPSITSYLCTAGARDIYSSGAAQLEAYVQDREQLSYPAYAPAVGGALTNQGVLGNIEDFLQYALAYGQRGTPHTV